jgi:hypothetical protein
VQAQPVGQPHEKPSAGQAKEGADAELLDEAHHDAGVEPGLAGGEQLQYRDGEENRHRVVARRLDFEQGRDALLQRGAGTAQQREHRRRVGRGDDGANQQALEPSEAEHPGGEQADQDRGHHDAHCSQAHCRP